MALYQRLLKGSTVPNPIPVHQFVALAAEFGRGRFTRAQVVAILELTPEEESELVTLYQRLTAAGVTLAELHDVLTLAERRMAYTTPAELRARLGT